MLRNDSRNIEHNFKYHSLSIEQLRQTHNIREKAKELAYLINDCPESRERSLAMTNLEQATMWANAAVSRN